MVSVTRVVVWCSGIYIRCGYMGCGLYLCRTHASNAVCRRRLWYRSIEKDLSCIGHTHWSWLAGKVSTLCPHYMVVYWQCCIGYDVLTRLHSIQALPQGPITKLFHSCWYGCSWSIGEDVGLWSKQTMDNTTGKVKRREGCFEDNHQADNFCVCDSA